MSQEKLARQVLATTNQDKVAVFLCPNLLGPVMVWSQQNYQILLKTERIFKFQNCCLENRRRRDVGVKMNK